MQNYLLRFLICTFSLMPLIRVAAENLYSIKAVKSNMVPLRCFDE